MNDKQIQEILNGNRRAISKAMTLLESTNPSDIQRSYKLLDQLTSHFNEKVTANSKTIAITGVPGVGKSTFIESLGMLLIKNGFKVAVLAIDPSSPISGGSLLGDKTRMEQLSAQANAFIRPSANSGHLGGVTKNTQSLIYLCQAAGFDYVLVETVGVGQSEYEIKAMTDLFILLTLPNSGDLLQGIKKGIMELADLILINKKDLDLDQAKLTKVQIEEANHLTNKKISVRLISALNSQGNDQNLDDLYKLIKELKIDYNQRKIQKKNWIQEILKAELYIHFKNSEKYQQLFNTSQTPSFSLIKIQEIIKDIKF